MFKLKWNLDKIINGINITLAVITVILLFCILIIICHFVFSDNGFSISITKSGVENLLALWGKQYSILLIALFSVSTLFIASAQFSRYLRIEEFNAIAKVREMLASKENMVVHAALLPSKREKEAEAILNKSFEDCIRYLGDLEFACLLVNNKVISFKIFKEQFGYRITNVYNTPSFAAYLRDRDRTRWETLEKMYDKIIAS